MPLIDQAPSSGPNRIEWSCKDQRQASNAIVREYEEMFTAKPEVATRPKSWLLPFKQELKPVSKSQKIVFQRLLRKRGFKMTLSRLNEVRYSHTYDEDFIRPTSYAYNQAMQLLVSSGGRLHSSFPLAWVCADGDGGLSFEWRQPERKLVLLVPATARGNITLYYESNLERIIDENISVPLLVERLTNIAH